MSVGSRSKLAAVLLAGAAFLAGCGGDESGASSPDAGESAAAVTIELAPTTFEPADATIAVGETVQWEWAGGVQHDVEGDGFKSKLQEKGTFSHTFEEAGTFDYRCNVHPTTMKGTITVG